MWLDTIGDYVVCMSLVSVIGNKKKSFVKGDEYNEWVALVVDHC